MVITIDGPAGSGKSTAARNLARALGIAYLDTGATYRAVTLKALREGVDLEDADALADAAGRARIHLSPEPAATRVWLDGEDVSETIRSEAVSEKSYYPARSPQVREVLVALQRRIGAELGSFVAEGRDQGTVVFPDADVKFYLVADASERAKRRCAELRARGESCNEQKVRTAIERRDRRDRTRDVAPLIKPDGAIEVDTTDRDVAAMDAALLAHVRERLDKDAGGGPAP
ncbi:MAG: (d)CMP kinase [Phycisphaerae bacterium]|nr:(d)CMP kinase [Phycisphaerae bacterium]